MASPGRIRGAGAVWRCPGRPCPVSTGRHVDPGVERRALRRHVADVVEPVAQPAPCTLGLERQMLLRVVGRFGSGLPRAGPAEPVGVRGTTDDEQVDASQRAVDDLVQRHHHRLAGLGQPRGDRVRDQMGVAVHGLVDHQALHQVLLRIVGILLRLVVSLSTLRLADGAAGEP